MDPIAPAPVQLVMDYRTQKIADLPLFNGDKTDAIAPEDFIRKTDAAKDAMRWDDATTAVHFKSCMRGNALNWLKSLEFTGFNTASWEILKAQFNSEFVQAFKEVSTLTAISHLTLKPDEHPRDYYSRVCQIFADIKKARPAFVANIPAGAAAHNVQISEQINSAMDHDMMHIVKCVFISGLPTEMREKVVDKRPLSALDAKKFATEYFEMQATRKASSKVSNIEAVTEDDWTEDKIDAIKDEEIREAILAIQQRRQGFFKSSGNQNFRGNNSHSNRSFQPNRNSQNRQHQTPNYARQNQTKHCQYCQMNNHNQEECFKRIKKGHALNDTNGKPMTTPGTHEFNFWKNELKAKGKTVMIIDDNSARSASNKSVTLN